MSLTDAARRNAAASRRLAREDPAAWLAARLEPWGIAPLGPPPGEPCPACAHGGRHACWPWIGGTRDDPWFGHCSGCHRTWRAAEAVAHCWECHRQFSSDEAFDRHRARGRCRDPLGMGADNLGSWSLPGRTSMAAARQPRAGTGGGLNGLRKKEHP